MFSFQTLHDPSSLRTLLADKDQDKRSKAILAIGQSADSQLVQSLFTLVEEDDSPTASRVKKAVVAALGLVREKEVKEQIVALAHHPSPQVCAVAARILGRMADPTAVSALLDLVASSGGVLCEIAVSSLVKIGDIQAAPLFMELLAQKERPEHRLFIIALGKLCYLPSQNLLEKILADQSSPFRGHAAEALYDLDVSSALENLGKLCQDENRHVQKFALLACCQTTNANAAEALLIVLARGYGEGAARKKLREMYQGKLEEIIHAGLQSQHVQVRKATALVCCQDIELEDVQPLLQLANDATEKMAVRQNAACALVSRLRGVRQLSLLSAYYAELHGINPDPYAWLPDSFDLEPCLAALHSRRPLIRSLAVKAIHYVVVHGHQHKLISEKGVKPLLQALTDKQQECRREAAVVLGVIGAHEAVAPLLTICFTPHLTYGSPPPSIGRAAIVFALGLIGGILVEEALFIICSDASNMIVGRAVDALNIYALPEKYVAYPNAFLKLGFKQDEDLRDLLLYLRQRRPPADQQKQKQLIPYLASEERLEVLVKTLRHRTELMRYIAARALGTYANIEAGRALVTALEQDTSVMVQESAAKGLKRRKTLQARVVAYQNDKSAKVRQAATEALPKITGEIGAEEVLAWYDEAR